MVVVGVMGAGVTSENTERTSPDRGAWHVNVPRSPRASAPAGVAPSAQCTLLAVARFRPSVRLPRSPSASPPSQSHNTHLPSVCPRNRPGDAKRDGLALDADLDLGGSAFFEPTAYHCVVLPDIHAGFRTLQHRSACSHGKD